MLGKLFRHDFRALSRTLFPLQIGVLAGTLVAALLTRLSIALDQLQKAQRLSHMVTGISTFLSMLIGLGIFASILVTLVIVLMRFYQNFLLDEGYLTFTLPVSTGKLLLSKLFTGMLWILISLAVVCVSGMLYVAFGIVNSGFINLDFLGMFRNLFDMLRQANAYFSVPLAGLELLVFALLALSAQLLEFYFAIVVGGQLAKKQKLLAAIGMYLVINMVVGILRIYLGVGGFGLLLFDGMNISGMEAGMQFFHRVMLLGSGINLILSAGFFFWSRYLLSKRLNLQ